MSFAVRLRLKPLFQLSFITLLLFLSACSRKPVELQKISLNIGRSSAMGKVGSLAFPTGQDICYAVNVSGHGISSTQPNACTPQVSIVSGFVKEGQALNLEVPRGAERVIEAFSYVVPTGDPCPSWKTLDEVKSADYSKIYAVAKADKINLAAQDQVVTLTAEYPGDSNHLRSQRSLSTGCSGGATPGTVTISIADISQPENHGSSMVFPIITLSAVQTVDVHVDFTTVDATATAGSDYGANGGYIVIPAGSLTSQVNISLINDATFEGNETFKVVISNPTFATTPVAPIPTLSIVKSESIITVIDDETAPLAVINSAPTGSSGLTTMAMYITGSGITHYKYKLGAGSPACTDINTFSSALPIASNITDDISALADGPVYVCVLGGTSATTFPSIANVVTATWTKNTSTPSLPSSLVLSIPASSPGTVAQPTIYAYGLTIGDTLKLYGDPTCSVMLNSIVVSAVNEGIQAPALAPNESKTYRVKVTNPSSVSTSCSSINVPYTYDPNPPSLVSLTSPDADGIYSAGNTITIQANFDEVVYVVNGPPSITLETGITDRVATYMSGSGTTILNFTYTVQPGDYSADLDVADQWQFSLNGANITDEALNNSYLMTPYGANPNSIASAKNIQVDGTAPTVSGITSSSADGSYQSGSIDVIVVFDEPVTVTGNPRILLETGVTDRYATYTSGSGTQNIHFTYSIQPGDMSADLNYASSSALELNGGTIRDAAMNDFGLTLPAPGSGSSLAAMKTIVVDGIYPTTWTGAGGNSNWNNAANWSGNTVPGAGDVARFDHHCNATCNVTLNAVVNVAGIHLSPTYTGTVTHTSYALNLGPQGYIQQGGTFAGGNSNIVVNGAFLLTGGTFTSTSIKLQIGLNSSNSFGSGTVFKIDSPASFNHNYGLVEFWDDGTVASETKTIEINGSHVMLFDLNFMSNGSFLPYYTFAGTHHVIVDSILRHDAGQLNGGPIHVFGTVNTGITAQGGTATIVMDGSSNQDINALSVSSGITCNLEVNKPSGILTVGGAGSVQVMDLLLTNGSLQFPSTYSMKINRDFIHAGGSFATGGAPLDFVGSTSGTIQILSGTLGSVNFAKTSAANLTINSNMSLSGNLNISMGSGGACTASGRRLLGSGFIYAMGSNITLTNGCGGTANVAVAGSASQTVTGSTTQFFPKMYIMSSGGTVTLGANMKVENNFVYAMGTVNASTTNLTLGGYVTSLLNSGPIVFNQVTFAKESSYGVFINSNLDLTSVSSVSFLSGELDMSGYSLLLPSSFSMSGGLISRNGGSVTINGVPYNTVGPYSGGTIN